MNLNQIEDTKETLNRMLALEISKPRNTSTLPTSVASQQADEASRIIKKAISDNPSPDFAESRDLIYSVLKLGDSAAALQLISDLEPALQPNPAYPLLKSDVLAANQQFLPALSVLEDTLNRLEFAPETLGSLASDVSKQTRTTLPQPRRALLSVSSIRAHDWRFACSRKTQFSGAAS